MMLDLGAVWQGKRDVADRAAREAMGLASDQGRTFDQIEDMFDLVHVPVYADRPVDVMLVDDTVALAKSTGSPIALMIASYAAGGAWARDEPDRAVRFLSQVRQLADEARIRNILVGGAVAREAVLGREHEPTRALGGLAAGLAYFRERVCPSGCGE